MCELTVFLINKALKGKKYRDLPQLFFYEIICSLN